MGTHAFTAAAAQLCSTEDLSANLDTCKRLATEAAGRGAKLLVLPENFAYLGLRERDKYEVAEHIDAGSPGPILAALIEMAASHEMWVIGGGMPELLPGESAGSVTRTYNACVALAPGGEIAAVYRKIHLFDVDIPGGAQLRESDSVKSGTELVAVETPLATIGMSVCYDLRFPELYRDLVVNKGAQVLVVPAAFTAHTGAAHWFTLNRSRAIENQSYVIAAAQYGTHNAKRESYGHTLIFDPWGETLAELPDGDGVATAEIDMKRLAKTRQQMPCLEHQVLLR